MNSVIDVVLVTYNPNMDMLIKCIDSIRLQVRKIWIVDNNSTVSNIMELLNEFHGSIELIKMSENEGIAHAQNIGIQKSIENNSDYILLCDQDTYFPSNYIEQMLPIFNSEPDNVAAVAPLFHDAVGKDKNEGFVTLSGFGYSRIFPDKGLYKINQAIASGLIIKSSTLNAIGLMDADLFIDWVDLEWCWRAIAKGYVILGNADVLIEHNLGDSSIAVGNKGINLRSPIRHYYITRNAFHLAWRCPYLDAWHRVVLICKGISYIGGFSILSKPRMMNLKMTLLGLYHSVIGRVGRNN